MKKILLFIFTFCGLFLINISSVSAKDKVFPDYSSNNINYKYCDYEIVGKNYYNNKHIYLVYVDGTIKYVNPKDNSLLNAKAAWDTGGINQNINYDATDLKNYLVKNNELNCHNLLYFQESGGDLIITSSYSTKSLGSSEGILMNGSTVLDDSYSVLTCNYSGLACEDGELSSIKVADIEVSLDNKNNIKSHITKGDSGYSSANIDSSVTSDLFANGTCPKLNIKCENNTCDISTNELKCSNTETSKKYQYKDIPKVPKIDYNTNTNDCSGVFGEFSSDLGKLFNIFKVLGPLIVFGFSVYEYIIAMVNNNQDSLKKANNRFIKRLVLMVALFLLPTIVDLFLKLLGVGDGLCM